MGGAAGLGTSSDIDSVGMSALAYQSNAARSLTELMEVEAAPGSGRSSLRSPNPAWPLPATDDESYASPQTLSGPRAARGSRLPDVDRGDAGAARRPARRPRPRPPTSRAARRPYLEEVLAAWRTYMPGVADAELFPAIYRSRWGEDFHHRADAGACGGTPDAPPNPAGAVDGAGEKLAPAVPMDAGRRPAAEDDAFCREAERLQQIPLCRSRISRSRCMRALSSKVVFGGTDKTIVPAQELLRAIGRRPGQGQHRPPPDD